MKESVWITWDDHRRSRELALFWNMEYKVFNFQGPRLIRYAFLTIKTLRYLFKSRPRIVVCQNPSIVLAAILTIFRRPLCYFLIVDRHSNFKISTRNKKNLKWRFFHFISDFSLRRSDLTIVTNEEAKKYITSIGARSSVLPDRLPSEIDGDIISLKGEVNFLFICSFDYDEPVEQVLNTFRQLGSEFHLYVTGNYRKYPGWDRFDGISNVDLLGFVSEKEYNSYLLSVDSTIVLTQMPMTLNCGSYESLRAMKPQIVSDSNVIKEWFSCGSVYVNPRDEVSIKKGILKMVEDLERFKKEQRKCCSEIEAKWNVLEKKFRSEVFQLSGEEL